jgi:hypothetical protein
VTHRKKLVKVVHGAIVTVICCVAPCLAVALLLRLSIAAGARRGRLPTARIGVHERRSAMHHAGIRSRTMAQKRAPARLALTAVRAGSMECAGS